MASGRSARKRRTTVRQRGGPPPALLGAIAVIVLFAGVVGSVSTAQDRATRTGRRYRRTPLFPGCPSAETARRPSWTCTWTSSARSARRTSSRWIPRSTSWVASGATRVVYHPVAYLDRFSSTRYSSRSSAAPGCAAEAGVFPQYAKQLFANQPPENGNGLPEEQLIALGTQAGAGGDFAECVASDRYAGWTAALTDEASRARVNATPTVQVNGREIEHSVEALRATVEAAP